jgi:hypothetical protein
MDGNDDAPNLHYLDQRRAALRARLEDGYQRIDAARLAGEDIERWESFWIDLLRQYEAICDEAEQAA